MNTNTPTATRALSALLGLLALTACGGHRGSVDADDQPAAAKPAARASAGAVTLTRDQAAKLGVATAAAQALTYTPETEGYGVVLSHEIAAQLAADLATAEASARQSRAVLARAQHLAGTPGAFSAEAQESAERQAAADAAALELARNKLTAALGRRPAQDGDDHAALLTELASGQAKLVRVTFPLGALAAAPKSLRLAHLDARNGARSLSTSSVWNAPADAAVPGRSFFALLEGSDVAEGERLRAWAASDAAVPGALVPAAALLVSEGKYWCYVEAPPGVFTRRPVDTRRPVADGYFVQQGVTPGEAIVIAAAGLVLARETNPAADTD